MKRVLVTAFEPFGGERVNPSQEVVRALRQRTFNGIHLETCELPVERFRAIELAREQIKRVKPEVVIMLGEAGGRAQITPERVAVNRDDFRIPDAAGQQPRGETIVSGGPMELCTTLPVEALIEHLTKAGIPAACSMDAGNYLCNRLFYCVLFACAQEARPVKAGFIHLPYLPEQAAQHQPQKPSLSLETQVDALALIIETV